ncbi:MAG TPA: methyltransferase domain-containing protein [Alphaproteobacteria bacterium]|nr:methyltransferase domain-containing protein [Alphaproteobacteria bacterium]
MEPTLERHRALWQTKPVLRAVYEDCYQRIAAACASGGRTLEIGGGTGNLKAYLPAFLSADIQFAPWLDLVSDAHRLPFADRSLRNLVLFDVLHHLERPRLFLEEAVRVLESGGRIVACEPAITPLSYLLYRLFHAEPVRLGDDPLAAGGLSPDRDPYDSNQAIPTRLFGRDRPRLEALVPALRTVRCVRFGFLAYPLSGGFRPWSALPVRFAAPILRFERVIEPVLGPIAAFRLLGVLEKR